MPQTQTTYRQVIYASDIRLLTGCSKRTSTRQIAAVKKQLARQSHQFVTIEEFCSYAGLDYEKTLVQLKLK